MGLTTKILIALILGAVFGHFLPEWAVQVKFIGDIFVRLIKLIVVPLIMSSLIVGIAGTGDFKAMGRIGLKAIIWFEFATTVALTIGWIAGNVLKPGVGVVPMHVNTSAAMDLAKKSVNLHDFFVNIFPANVVQSMANSDMLQIVVFCCIFGVAMAAVGKKAEPVLNVANGIAETMFKFTHYIMKLAPYGVFAFISYTVGTYGVAVLLPLAKLVGSLYLAIIVFIFVVLMLFSLVAKVSFFHLLRALKEPLLLGFTTASSEAALPMAMERLEEFGVPNRIASFVLPLGYSLNLDGSTLYCTLAVLFMSQVYHVDLSWTQQLTMFFMFMLSSKGIAGVPGASLIIIAGTASYFGLPIEGIALIMGVDRIMDMARTACNLMGNCVATVLVARWEGELPQAILQAAYKKSYTE